MFSLKELECLFNKKWFQGLCGKNKLRDVLYGGKMLNQTTYSSEAFVVGDQKVCISSVLTSKLLQANFLEHQQRGGKKIRYV